MRKYILSRSYNQIIVGLMIHLFRFFDKTASSIFE